MKKFTKILLLITLCLMVVMVVTACQEPKGTYAVLYYFENLEDGKFYVDYAESRMGEAAIGEVVKETPKEYEHFTKAQYLGMTSARMPEEGVMVLELYYRRNTYTLSADTKALDITNLGSYKYGSEPFVVTASPYIGYNFIGWYSGDTLLSTDKTFTFNADKNVYAKCEIVDELKDYYFESTHTTCTLTGMKNDTRTGVTIPSCVTHLNGTFRYNDVIQSVIIKDNVVEIGERTFYEATSLKTVILSGSVKTIKQKAFYCCTSLESINIPYGVETIENDAFYGCTSLGKVSISNSVTSIGDYAFDANLNGTSPIIYCQAKGKPQGWSTKWYLMSTIVWDYVNNNVAVDGNEYTIVNGLIYAIKNDEATLVKQPSCITDATIPSSITYNGKTYPVTAIGNNAFYNHTDLKRVFIPGSIKKVGDWAFYGCENMNYLKISNGVEKIGMKAFAGTGSLAYVIIPSSVKEVDSSGFACSVNTRIYCEATKKPSDYSSYWTNYPDTVYWYSDTKPTTNGFFWHYDGANQIVIWR